MDLTDRFLGLLANFWESLIITGRLDDAKHYMQAVCSLALDWDNKNKPAKIHKGTPYFFLAKTYRIQGDLDSTFLYAYCALEEDKRSFGIGHKSFPAYMYASLVDDPRNTMYYYVSQMKKTAEGYITDYQNDLRIPFTYADFDSKFLQSNMEDLKHFFVYNLELLMRYEKLQPEIFGSGFTKLRILDMIFNLCLIADKILESKFHQRSIGANLVRLVVAEKWGRKPGKKKVSADY